MANSAPAEEQLDLSDLEAAVYCRNYEQAGILLLKALSGFEHKTWDLVTLGEQGVTKNRDVIRSKQLLSRFCAAVIALFSDPQFQLNRQGFELMMVYKRFLLTVFAATDFGHMRHVLELIGERTADNTVSYTRPSDLFKVIIITNSACGPELVAQLLRALPEDLSFLLWLSLLDNEMVLTEQESETRQQVLELAERYTTVIPSEQMMCRVINAWMFLSYMADASKHSLKVTLNAVIKRYCQKQGVKQPYIGKRKGDKSKPVVLIPCERFTSDHAMYRCYGRAIESLKGQFELVFMGLEGRYDQNSIELFDQHILLPNEHKLSDIKATIGRVIKLNPDIIYYPSIGMESWVVALAQYRLAPIQMMTMGHPATTHSPVIDYLFAEESTLGDPSCNSEMCLHVRDHTFAMSKGTLNFQVAPKITEIAKVIKVAVPSIAYKLNPSVLAACQEIQARAARPVEFHFFPNMTNVNHLAIRLRLQAIMPCVVHENMHYKDYMATLSQCDLVMSPFPFGNTNGFIDSVRLGLPVVCMDGPEAHSHTDIALSKRFGLPEFCRTDNTEDYIDAVLLLINDNDLRVSTSRELVALNVDELLYGDQPSEAKTDMVALFQWVYRHHESIQAAGKHCWSVEERQAFCPELVTEKTDHLAVGS